MESMAGGTYRCAVVSMPSRNQAVGVMPTMTKVAQASDLGAVDGETGDVVTGCGVDSDAGAARSGAVVMVYYLAWSMSCSVDIGFPASVGHVVGKSTFLTDKI